MTLKFTDPNYLKTDQYRDSTNLEARVKLHQRFSTNPQGWFPWVFDILMILPRDARVLELGCGPGLMWQECRSRIPEGWNITLSDFSDGMLDAAWRNLVVTGRNFKFEKVDVQSIPYADETFDIVIANYMLYHVPDRPKAISEIWRVLKVGGHLIAATGGANHLKEINDWMQRIGATADISMYNPFTLDNGLAQLQPFFEQIELHRYPDNLRIIEIPPLMAYLRSMIRTHHLTEAEFNKMEQELHSQLVHDGEIFITKDSGLFLARR